MVKAISMTGVLVVKMKDVAELAGVSSAAVSRYLNGGYISADKAERIKHAIELTGYVRSSQARALRTGSTKLIGVIVPKINSESVSRITAGYWPGARSSWLPDAPCQHRQRGRS